MQRKLLLNLDKPHRTAVLHTEGCPLVPVPTGTQHKPFPGMGRDGGWFEVDTEEEAKTVAAERLPRGDFIRCQRC